MTKKHKQATKRPKEKRLTSLKELADIKIEPEPVVEADKIFDANQLIDNILKKANS